MDGDKFSDLIKVKVKCFRHLNYGCTDADFELVGIL